GHVAELDHVWGTVPGNVRDLHPSRLHVVSVRERGYCGRAPRSQAEARGVAPFGGVARSAAAGVLVSAVEPSLASAAQLDPFGELAPARRESRSRAQR